MRLFWDPVLIYWRVNAGGCVGIIAVGQPPTLEIFPGLSESWRMRAALKGRQKSYSREVRGFLRKQRGRVRILVARV